MTNRLLATLVLSLSLLACDGGKADTADTDTGDVDTEAESGAEMFSATCANCHGPNGNDGSAPDLTVAVPGLDDSALETLINEGQGYMPPQDIDAADLPVLIAHLRATFP